MIRTALGLNHWLHWASSIIVMSIAAYFIAKFAHNQHLIYWVTIVRCCLLALCSQP
jgi:hypothetical protein